MGRVKTIKGKTYNGLEVPKDIRTDRIVSAFANSMDWQKVEFYTQDMKRNDHNSGHHGFPPIKGFPSIVDTDDLDNEDFGVIDLEGRSLKEGDLVWMVTNGHHRTFAAIKAGISLFEVELDRLCITNEDEL